MKQKMTLGMLGVLLFTSAAALTSCKHDADDYLKKPYVISNEERLKHAEEQLGVSLDRQQDWVLTQQYSVKAIADADLENISEVVVLDANPLVDEATELAAASVNKDGEVTLTFYLPKYKDVELLYVACYTADKKQCMVRPFIPGEDQEVSFREKLNESAKARTNTPYQAIQNRRAQTEATILEPDKYNFSLNDYPSFWRAIEKLLPEGEDNRSVIGSHDYTNLIQIRENPYSIYDIPVAFIGGDNQTDIHLLYTYYEVGDEENPNPESFIITDSYDGTGTIAERTGVKTWTVKGHYLQCRQIDKTFDRQFTPGDKIYFQLAKGDELLPDTESDKRVKIFMLNGYVFIACEDGVDENCDWDYNDRVYWMPYGAERITKATGVPFTPEPTKMQIWTYTWEDRDKGDYDLNDCVIKVQHNAKDKNKLDITLVALGATRELWLGFDNKNAQSYNDYLHVFEQELHEVLRIPVGKMANTGNGTLTVDSVMITIAKPAGFDFQSCSFILGAKFEKDQQGLYDSDYYAIKIATTGEDPHGIVIPGQWQWPTERTCIKDAYPDFIKWAGDRTKNKNWYNNPVPSNVVKKR